MTLYLKDTTFLDWQTLEIKPTNLAVAQGPQQGISYPAAVPSPDDLGSEDRVLDCAGKLVTKSFGCGHHHIYSTLARGMPAPPRIPANFLEVLEYIWWRVDKRLDRDMIEASALAAALQDRKSVV